MLPRRDNTSRSWIRGGGAGHPSEAFPKKDKHAHSAEYRE